MTNRAPTSRLKIARRFAPIALVAILGVAAAACGSSSGAWNGGAANPNTSTTAGQSGGGSTSGSGAPRSEHLARPRISGRESDRRRLTIVAAQPMTGARSPHRTRSCVSAPRNSSRKRHVRQRCAVQRARTLNCSGPTRTRQRNRSERHRLVGACPPHIDAATWQRRGGVTRSPRSATAPVRLSPSHQYDVVTETVGEGHSRTCTRPFVFRSRRTCCRTLTRRRFVDRTSGVPGCQ